MRRDKKTQKIGMEEENLGKRGKNEKEEGSGREHVMDSLRDRKENGSQRNRGVKVGHGSLKAMR